MTKVSNEGDATYLNQVLDARTHHRSRYLEDLLAPELSKPVYCASLSIPGMNASDVSVVSTALLKPPKNPALVVYGIAPRDLMDNALSMPSQTSTFHLMEKISDLSAVGYDARLGIEARFKYCVNRALKFAFPLYRYQEEIALKWHHWCRNELACLAAKDSLAAKGTANPVAEGPEQIEKMLIALHAVQEEFDLPIHSVPDSLAKPEDADLKNCYIASYNPFRKQQYQSQFQFLSSFLDTCQTRGIKVLLVNMPLRGDSFQLMPDGFYQRYVNDVSSVATAKHAVFLDFEKTESFADADFVDQVHLSGAGGGKFVRYLARAIQEHHLLRPQDETVTVAARKATLAQ